MRAVVCVIVGLLCGSGDPQAGRRLAASTLAPFPQEALPPWTVALRAALDAAAPALPAGVRDDLTRFYAQRNWMPAWLDANGDPSRVAAEAEDLLGHAASDGFNPEWYGAGRPAAMLVGRTDRDPRSGAVFDVALTAGIVRYLRDLHLGHVDPRAIGLRLERRPETHDVSAVLNAALSRGRVSDATTQLTPTYAQYQLLRSALAHYRALRSTPALAQPLVIDVRVIKPGERSPAIEPLRRVLVALGDLASAPAALDDLYDQETSEGVKHFQARHGLAADGVIGPATQRALRVPIAWRVRQIELALERLRWVSDLGTGRLIAVNIPMFRLWAWDAVPSSQPPVLDMAVIVGRALGHKTPVFVDEIASVIFRPPWNVPRSIVRGEILPELGRDSAYLERHGFEIVREAGDNGRAVATTAESIAMLAAGGARLRQRPGPANALGLVKFVLPNDYDVYLHDTPATELFQRTRRDFSHGCIRVEDPATLAAWALKDHPEWTREAIEEAMQGTKTVGVALAAPIQVVIFYTTVVVEPADGTVFFAEDLYGQDAPLDRVF